MKGAIKLFSFKSIPVYIHWSFSFILLIIGALWIKEDFLLNEMVFSFLLTLSLFTCVVLHEFGHALTARRYGIETQDIIISPIGGLARLRGLPKKAVEEIWITLAGPLVNLVLIILLLPITAILPIDRFIDALVFNEPLPEVGFVVQFIVSIIVLNGVLFVFNLLPIFPMDGGRIFRATLSFFLSFKKATTIAVRLGQFCSVILFGLGVYFFEPIWCAMAVFLCFSGQMELSGQRMMVKDIDEDAIPPIQSGAPITKLEHLTYYPDDTSFTILNAEHKRIGTISASKIQEAISFEPASIVNEWMSDETLSEVG